MKLGTCLHVGCGSGRLPEDLKVEREIRVDISPESHPDIVADMRNLGDIGEFDAVYCSHALEHVTKEDGVRTLREFHRVLRPGGVAIVIVPDLEDVRPTADVVYVSPAGPITGADMYWGFQPVLERFPFMKHQFGYVSSTLAAAFREAGFEHLAVSRQPGWELVTVATK